MTDDDLPWLRCRTLEWEAHVPDGLVDVQVSDGVVTLRGLVESPLEIDAAEAAVRRLSGIVGLHRELQLGGPVLLGGFSGMLLVVTARLRTRQCADQRGLDDTCRFRQARRQSALIAATSLTTDSRASPKSICVFGSRVERVVDPGEARAHASA